MIRVMTRKLHRSISTSPLGNETPATEIYASPLTMALVYDFGTLERTAIVDAYKHIRKLLCITGLCLCIPTAGFRAVVAESQAD